MTFTLPDGQEIDAEEVDFEITDEEWNEYELDDGTTIEVKLVLKRVLRHNDQYTHIGEPTYTIESENIIRLSDVPEELRREPPTDLDIQ